MNDDGNDDNSDDDGRDKGDHSHDKGDEEKEEEEEEDVNGDGYLWPFCSLVATATTPSLPALAGWLAGWLAGYPGCLCVHGCLCQTAFSLRWRHAPPLSLATAHTC